MLFVIEVKDKREDYLLKALKNDGYDAVKADDAPSNAEPKIYVYSIRNAFSIERIDSVSPGSVVFARDIDDASADILDGKQITYFDYNKDEDFLVKNAYLTAEGALAHIINNTDCKLQGLSALILGYGRVGQALSAVMKQNGANVCVAARNTYARAAAEGIAARVYTMESYIEDIAQFDTIINTIPDKILKGEILASIDKDCFVLDLASAPGGVDFDTAKAMGINALLALGIPGKTAPKTAALYLKESILASLNIKHEK